MSSLKYIFNKNVTLYVKDDEESFSPLDTINSTINSLDVYILVAGDYIKVDKTKYNLDYYTDDSGKIYSRINDCLYSSIGNKIDSILTENKTKYNILTTHINNETTGNFKNLNDTEINIEYEIETEGEV